MGRRWSSRHRVAVALALAVLAAAARAEDGDAAPPGQWCGPFGSPAYTAVARTPPVAGPVEQAWVREGSERIADVVVTGPHAVTIERTGRGRAAIRFLRVADGTVDAERSVKLDGRVHVAQWDGTVVVGDRSGQVAAYRARGDVVARIWQTRAAAPIDALNMIGSEVYVRAGDRIARYRLGGRLPVWTASGAFRGPLVLRGNHVYTTFYDDSGNASVEVRQRSDGSVAISQRIGHHKGKIPEANAAMTLQVLSDEVHLQYALAVPISAGTTAEACRLPRSVNASTGQVVIGQAGLGGWDGERTEFDTQWVGLSRVDGGAIALTSSRDDGRLDIIASAEVHPDWVQGSEHPSRTGDVILVSGRAFDGHSLRVAWESEEVGAYRAIPARGVVLLPTAPDRLVALREQGAAEQAAIVLGDVPAGSVRASLVDGRTLSGPATVDVEAGTLSIAKQSVRLSDVRVATDAKGTPFLAGPGDAAAHGAAAMADAGRASQLAKLALAAARAFDVELAESLIAEATTLGAAPSEVAPATKKIAGIAKLSRAPARKAAAADDVLCQADAVRAEGCNAAAELYSRLPETAPADIRFGVLDAVLRTRPDHEPAVAAVRAMLPPDTPVASPFVAREWLIFAQAIGQSPVTILQPPESDSPDLTPSQRTLGVLSHTWRKGLVGVQSEQILVVTPLERPGAVARCLSMGELVCDRLEALFAGGKSVRTARSPLTLLLYDTQESYREASGEGTTEWTSGHYSPRDELARLYLPEDDAAFRRVMAVFAHELTHQWLAERCPLFTTASRKDSSKTPGYWVVEGAAEMVEEELFDLERRTWRFDPRARSITVVTVLPPDDLLPWELVTGASSAEFRELSRDKEVKFDSPRRLGHTRTIDEISRFYVQSAALAHYLHHADDGRLREKLISFLAAHYRGEPPEFEAHFGMSPAEAGTRVRQWAESVTKDL